eukprot:539894_1
MSKPTDNKNRKQCILPHNDHIRWTKITKVFKDCNVSNMQSLQKLYSHLPIEQYPSNKLSCLQLLLQTGDNNQHQITSKLFFDCILQNIINLVLLLPKLFNKPLYILNSQIKQNICLTSIQCASILSCSFFGLHNRPNPTHIIDIKNNIIQATFSDINFTSNNGFAGILNINNESVQTKLYMILNYFLKFNPKYINNNSDDRKIIFHRRVLSEKELINDKILTQCNIPLSANNFSINSKNNNEKKKLLIDFANAFIGGGSLSGGNHQEEILFCVYTECIVSGLFTEKMNKNECIIIQNCRKYNINNYKGFGDKLKINDDIKQQINYEEKENIVCDTIVAIDALICFSDNFEEINQFENALMLREINKAYIGFSYDINNNKYVIVTGNWGCGAFGGNSQLKSMLQWIASLVANKRDIDYRKQKSKANLFENVIKHCSKEKKYCVSDLWKLLKDFNTQKNENKLSLFEYLLIE